MLQKGIITGILLFFFILIFNVTSYAINDIYQPIGQYLEARGLPVEYVNKPFGDDIKLTYFKNGNKTEVLTKDLPKKNMIVFFWAPHYNSPYHPSVDQLKKFSKFIQNNNHINGIVITLNDGKPIKEAEDIIKTQAPGLDQYGYYYDTQNKSFFGLLVGDSNTVPPLYILYDKNGEMFSLIPGAIDWDDEKMKHLQFKRAKNVHSSCKSCRG